MTTLPDDEWIDLTDDDRDPHWRTNLTGGKKPSASVLRRWYNRRQLNLTLTPEFHDKVMRAARERKMHPSHLITELLDPLL